MAVLNPPAGALIVNSGINVTSGRDSAHIIKASGDVENVLAVQNTSTGAETYSSVGLFDQNGQEKATFGFGNVSTVVWKRRVYLESWEGQDSDGEVPDVMIVQTRNSPSWAPYVRMRCIGASSAAPSDIVFYRNVSWSSDTEPSNARALTIKADGTGLVLADNLECSVRHGANTAGIGIYGGSNYDKGGYLSVNGQSHTTASKRGRVDIYGDVSDAHADAGSITFGTHSNGSSFTTRFKISKSGEFELSNSTSFIKWANTGLEQTTVGAAGAAAALPATPSKYFKFKDSAGTVYVFPGYLAS